MISRTARIKFHANAVYPDQNVNTKSNRILLKAATSKSIANRLFASISSVFSILVFVALIAGFSLKKNEIFVPGEGLGYALGIAGGIAMLSLLAYPLVKRTRLFRNGLQSNFWFRWHMVLGILGPLLILYHSNFSTGATNSNVALFSMIIVSASGVIGRYIYGRVHNGMYGAKLDVSGLLARANRLVTEIEDDVGGASGVLAKALADFAERVLPKKQIHIMNGIAGVMTMPWRVFWARSYILRKVRFALKSNARKKNWSRAETRAHLASARRDVDEFLTAVSRAALMSFWERVFSLWHIMHIPLFFVLIVSGVIHVIAVHLY